MILIGGLLLLVWYGVVFFVGSRRGQIPVAWWVVALGIGGAASGGLLLALFAGPGDQATEIAWTGIAGRLPGDALELGGSRQKATIGWPNGSFSPAVRVEAGAARGEVSIRISGGGGFVRGPEGFLNGTPLPESAKTRIGDFTIETGALPWRLCIGCRTTLKVWDANGTKVAEFAARAGSEPRVSSLYSNLTVDIARLRKTDGQAAGALEAWSSNLRLLVARGGVRVLAGDSGDTASAGLKLPAKIAVYWPGQSQPVELKGTPDGRVSAVFLPPWRLATRLPEVSADGKHHLTLEARAQPGDTAFLLPLGGELRGFHETLTLDHGRFAGPDKGAAEFAKVLSEHTVRLGSSALRFAAVADRPDVFGVSVLIMIATGIYGWGLWLASARLRWRDGWVLGGVLSSIWVILLIRVLLAFRYAADPAHFDKFAFDGVESAVRWLCVGPAFWLTAVRLRRDRSAMGLAAFSAPADRRRAGRAVLAYIFAVVVAQWANSALAHTLWPNEQARYAVGGFGIGSLFFGVLIGAAAVWLVGYVFMLYFYDPDREVSQRMQNGLHAVRGVVMRRVVEPLTLEQSRGFWRHLGNTLEDEASETAGYLERFRIVGIVLGTLVVAALLIGLVARVAGANQKFVQEIAAPALLCWMPASLLLAARLRFQPGSRMSRRGYGWILPWGLAGALLIFAPVILFPVALGDAGGIVAAFSFFWPASALLIAGGRPRRLQWMPALVLLGTVAMAGVIYLNLNYVTKLPGEAQVRLLIFKEGLNLEERMPGLPMLKEDAGRTPTLRQVSQGLQHTWENKAIAHEGGWFGLGYGKAPVRRSQVPQHTLQVDSTYSFYIASEFGLVGGLALLAIYAMPLFWVLIGARSRFDAGYGIATLVAAAFLLEAVFHAGMNLTALPYTGRDLPLLAVGSFTDFLRWTLLFGVAVRALQWRVTGLGDTDGDYRTESIILPTGFRYAVAAIAALPVILTGLTVYRGVEIIRDAELSRPFQWTRLLNSVRQAADTGKLHVNPKTVEIEVTDDSLAQQGGTLMEQEIARFNALSESEKLEGLGAHAAEFRKRLARVRTLGDYDKLMGWLRSIDNEERPADRPLLFRVVADARSVDEDGRVLLTDPGYRILPNPAFNTSVSFHEAKREEIPAVTLPGQAVGTFLIRGTSFEFRLPDLAKKLADERVVILEEEAGGGLRKIGDNNPDGAAAKIAVRHKPAKDKKGRLGAKSFEFGQLRTTGGGLVFRPSVDVRLVRVNANPKKLVKFAPEKLVAGDRIVLSEKIGKNGILPSFTVERTAQGALIGPAWVMGQWVPTYDPDPIIPWTANLANALPDEQARYGKNLPARFGTLTFDKSLQGALQTFATEKGRAHYGEYLGSARGLTALPPRVAIAVVSLRGEVAGMGGWPRMNSSRNWDVGPGGDAIPPFTWVDREAPHSLRLRYQGDRNFDRIAVGSASKPLWASAVMRMHRNLENELAVRGDGEEENDVFGIKIPGKPWAAHPSGWRGLEKFLSTSDNRYQVRLGFLGLAKSDADRPTEIARAEASGSVKESMDGGETVWGRYPVFDDGVDFRPARPGRIRGLEGSKLAERLKAMFGIGVETGEIVHRRSFWTGDEANDWGPASAAPLSQVLEYTSPEAPNFELNRIEDPRRFVTLLLGGGTNLWSNVDFAGAFGTAVLGSAVTPHITRIDADQVKPGPGRGEGFENPAAFYAGLKGVIDGSDGTAYPYLKATQGLGVLQRMEGVQHYAKTGTLGSETGPGNVSRIVLVLVKGDRSARQGVVISVVVEHAALGTASAWLGEFLVANEADLRRLVGLR